MYMFIHLHLQAEEVLQQKNIMEHRGQVSTTQIKLDIKLLLLELKQQQLFLEVLMEQQNLDHIQCRLHLKVIMEQHGLLLQMHPQQKQEALPW